MKQGVRCEPVPTNTTKCCRKLPTQVSKYIYRAPLITSESEALGFAARGY